MAVGNSAQAEEDHCSKAAPPQELVHHSLWPVPRCLQALKLSSLTWGSMHVCVRKSPQKLAYHVHEYSGVVCYLARKFILFFVSTLLGGAKSSRSYHMNRVPAVLRKPPKNVANTQHPVGPSALLGIRDLDVHAFSRQTRRPAVLVNPETRQKPIPAPTRRSKVWTRRHQG